MNQMSNTKHQNYASTNYGLYLYPWHKSRNGDSFIFVFNLVGNYIQIYHNGIELKNAFYNHNTAQMTRVVVPKRFVLAASFTGDHRSDYYNTFMNPWMNRYFPFKSQKRNKNKHRPPPHVILHILVRDASNAHAT